MIVSNNNGQNRGPARGALAYEAELSLRRLQPRLDAEWERSQTPAESIARFESRLAQHWLTLFQLLHSLYGQRYDFFYHLEQILLTLRELDAHLINEPVGMAGESES